PLFVYRQLRILTSTPGRRAKRVVRRNPPQFTRLTMADIQSALSFCRPAPDTNAPQLFALPLFLVAAVCFTRSRPERCRPRLAADECAGDSWLGGSGDARAACRSLGGRARPTRCLARGDHGERAWRCLIGRRGAAATSRSLCRVLHGGSDRGRRGGGSERRVRQRA